jgi:hypothetical protein
LEAMPACLKPFADQTEDGKAMLDALAEAHSDESERVLVLSELNGARLEGAARFFASWEFRTKRGAELNRLPESVKRALLEHSLQSTDPAKRARAQKAFGWVM